MSFKPLQRYRQVSTVPRPQPFSELSGLTHDCQSGEREALNRTSFTPINTNATIIPPMTLTQLPREIRDSIYAYVFTTKEIRPASEDESTLTHPLLLVNRQISAEAAFSFYNNRVFIGHPHELLCFLERVGNRRNLINVVNIECFSLSRWYNLMPQLFRLLSCMSGLRSVKLTMAERNLAAAQRQLRRMGLDLLMGQAETTIYERFLAYDTSHGRWEMYNVSVYKRAAGAIDWVTEKEEFGDISAGTRRFEGHKKIEDEGVIGSIWQNHTEHHHNSRSV